VINASGGRHVQPTDACGGVTLGCEGEGCCVTASAGTSPAGASPGASTAVDAEREKPAQKKAKKEKATAAAVEEAAGSGEVKKKDKQKKKTGILGLRRRALLGKVEPEMARSDAVEAYSRRYCEGGLEGRRGKLERHEATVTTADKNLFQLKYNKSNRRFFQLSECARLYILVAAC